jgi:hypothetical protein
VYEDGPSKSVEETDSVNFDPDAATYSEADNGNAVQVFKVTGYEALRSGRGTLVLTGSGTDNSQPSETRVTLEIQRNLLDILGETRPAGSTGDFAFRHSFRFTRAVPPEPFNGMFTPQPGLHHER